jgi:uroporphyrinogen-III synthase
MATSNESLVNIMRLVKCISSNLEEVLISKKIIVFSERLKEIAEDFGFNNIETTENPSDEDLINLLINKN